MSEQESVLFSGGDIFVESGELLSDHAVLVEGDRIKSVASVATFDGFTGRTIDIAGSTLIPGLIDCHVHLLFGSEGDPGTIIKKMRPGELVVRGLENAEKTLRGGITSVRDCGGIDYLEFSVRDACNQERFAGPRIRAAGKMICMTGGHGNEYGRVADGEDDVVRAVREQIHAGCDFVKIMATGGVMTKGVDPEDAHYSLAEISSGIAEATRFRRTTASHAQGAEGILNATRGGVTSIEHGIFMNEECISEMLARDTYLVPTLAALQNIVSNTEAGIPDYIMEKAERCADAHRNSIKSFYDAGGRIAMGTDAGTPFNGHGENAQELEHMVGIGISPADAILSATATAADLLTLEEGGRIKSGSYADMLCVSGNPIADIKAVSDTANHQWVMKAGTLFE